jgi:hypothetical protein
MSEDEIARLLAMSDEEILATARADGVDIDGVARDMAEQFAVIARLLRERDKARELLGRSWVRNAQTTRAERAEALIAAIETHLDSPSWEHELTTADDGMSVECQGQDVLRAMIGDWRAEQ